MANQCAICEKKKMVVWRIVKLRGKYNPTKKRFQKPNLQWAKLPARIAMRSVAGGASGKRVKACAKCIKKLAKT